MLLFVQDMHTADQPPGQQIAMVTTKCFRVGLLDNDCNYKRKFEIVTKTAKLGQVLPLRALMIFKCLAGVPEAARHTKNVNKELGQSRWKG